MTLRAGSYQVSVFKGVIRDDSFPVYTCIHSHKTVGLARACAREALHRIKATPKESTLPPGWIPYSP